MPFRHSSEGHDPNMCVYTCIMVRVILVFVKLKVKLACYKSVQKVSVPQVTYWVPLKQEGTRMV